MLAAIVLLPRLLTGGAEPPSDAVKLNAPRVQFRVNEASATRSPWIDANGWQMIRKPGRSFFYKVTGDAAALAAAEAFTYDTDALISTDAAGAESFNRMLEFLQKIPKADLSRVADIGIVDDSSDATGEVMNLLTRMNLLFRIVKAPDKNLRVNVRLGTKEYPLDSASNPSEFAHKIRSQIGDDHRSLRIYGSEVVVARFTANSRQGRVCLLNYSERPVRGLRVRVRGAYAKGEAHIFGQSETQVQDWARDGDATEFSLAELGTYAVIDLSR
jgi:hypothetical protein